MQGFSILLSTYVHVTKVTVPDLRDARNFEMLRVQHPVMQRAIGASMPFFLRREPVSLQEVSLKLPQL